MKQKLLSIIFFIVCWLQGELFALTQTSSTWAEAIGKSGTDAGLDIKQYANGDYVIVGHTQPEGSQDFDIYIARLNGNGDIIWQKTIGSQFRDHAYTIDITPDGGVIIGGTVQKTANTVTYDILIIKLDAQGNIEWKKVFDGGQTNTNDYTTQVHSTLDGGYIVSSIVTSVGAGGYDMSIIKLDANGGIEWQKTLGSTTFDYTYNIIQLPNGDYMLAGNSFETNLSAGTDVTNNIVIAKIGQNGNLLSQKYIGTLNGNEGVASIKRTSDNGYILSGEYFTTTESKADAYILKLDESGNIEWQKRIGGSAQEYSWDVVETSDQGFLMIADTNSTGAGSFDILLTKFDKNGNVQWQKTIGGTEDDSAKKIIKTQDNNYIIIGYSYSFGAGGQDIFIVKVNENGEILDNNCSLIHPANLDVLAHNADYRDDIPPLQYKDSNLTEITIDHQEKSANLERSLVCRSTPTTTQNVTVPMTPMTKLFIVLLILSSALFYISKQKSAI